LEYKTELGTALPRLRSAKQIARVNNNHKLYTFTHVSDTNQTEFLENIGFVKRGMIESPYKSGHNLLPLDMMID
jgi:hypothetical protein